MSEGRDLTQAPSSGGDPSLLGRTIAGKFVVEKFLGGGAMGAVYRARWQALEKNVAIKVMHRSIAQEASFAARFAREAKAAARLDHPNSIRVIDSGEEADGLLYIAMEYVEGRDLYRVIHEDWPISDADIVDILAQALSAIGVAHEMGVIHRDLKPENLMILPGRNDGEEGRYRVKVCDFGIAKITSKGADGNEGPSISHNLTTHGLVVGTPEYMSPEQARGEKLDARSDIYSIGVILYQLLTGRTPFTGDHALAVVLQHVTATPPAPHEIYPDVHKGLEAVCVKAIAKEREDRYQTARDMRLALRAAVDGKSATTPTGDSPVTATVNAPAAAPAQSEAVTRVTPPGIAAAASPPKKSRAGLFIGAAVVLAVLAAAAVYASSISGGGILEANEPAATPSASASVPAISVAALPSASVSASGASSVHSAQKAPKIGVVASSSSSSAGRPAASVSAKGTERAVAPSASASTGSSLAAPPSSSSSSSSSEPAASASSTSSASTASAASTASPAASPTPSQVAPSFNPAGCKAHLGAPKSTGSVNAKDLRLNGTAAAWNTCAQRMKEKPATPITTSVRLRFGDNKSFHGASCTACPPPVAHCIAQSTGKTVALELHGGDVTGEPAFDVPVTLSCD